VRRHLKRARGVSMLFLFGKSDAALLSNVVFENSAGKVH
jgi:hypothetical protein